MSKAISDEIRFMWIDELNKIYGGQEPHRKIGQVLKNAMLEAMAEKLGFENPTIKYGKMLITKDMAQTMLDAGAIIDKDGDMCRFISSDRDAMWLGFDGPPKENTPASP